MKYTIIILVILLYGCLDTPQPQITEHSQIETNAPSNQKIIYYSKDTSAYTYTMNGLQKSKNGDKQGAIEDYTRAIMVNPNYDIAYFNRGVVKDDIDDKKGAIADWTKAIELNPKDVDIYLARALTKHELGDDEGEIADYRLAIKNCKPDADIYNNLGTALYDLKRFKESADAYTEGIKHFPKDYRFYYGRGLARHQMEDRDGACEDWHKSSDLGCFEANAMFPLCDEDYKNKHKK